MEVNLVQLGKLIEKCQKSGVSRLKLGDDVDVEFGVSVSAPENVVTLMGPQENERRVLQVIKERQESSFQQEEMDMGEVIGDEDDMLHLSDPVAWERRERSDDEDKTVAMGGDEVEGNYDV